MLGKPMSNMNQSAGHHDDFLSLYQVCISSIPVAAGFITFNVINVVLHSALSTFILHSALQVCLKSPGAFSTRATHSDCFTYAIAAMELFGVVGSGISSFCIVTKSQGVAYWLSSYLMCAPWFGEILFHLLTCMERYLAVKHPVTYRGLKGDRGVRIRNLLIASTWLLSAAGTATISSIFKIANLILLLVSMAIVSFCSLLVLRALIHPGPGDQSSGSVRGDQSKRKAFHTILMILAVLSTRFVWGLVWAVLYIENEVGCEVMSMDVWFNLPSSVLLQILFLNRAGKLKWLIR